MDEKSLEMLEFPRIREILASFTSFSASRELAITLKPQRSYEQISLLLRQAAEARQLLSLDPGFAIGDVLDIRETVKMAALERVLEPQSLLEIPGALWSFARLRRILPVALMRLVKSWTQPPPAWRISASSCGKSAGIYWNAWKP